MAARSIGSLSISFGLVSIPVKLYSATEASRAISFNLLHKACGSRLKQQYTCPKDNEVVTRDELDPRRGIGIRSWVNGTQMQDSSTSELIFGVNELIAYLSRSFTLQPGDVIATGTPLGVGAFRTPPVFLRDGDVVEVELEGIGRLRNTCRVVGKEQA